MSLADEFHPFPKSQQVKKRSKSRGLTADERRAYERATEAARNAEGYLVCALCGQPGLDDEMDRDHIRSRGAGGKTEESNLRITHHDCHIGSHQTGNRQPHKR